MQFFTLTLIFTTIGCGDTTPSDSPNKMTADAPSTRAKTAQKKSTTQEEADASKAETESPRETQKDAGKTIKAKFVEFGLGDAQHFIFIDETGKRWDFSGSQEKTLKFEKELPLNEATEENHGWTSNPQLQGKWFQLTYFQTEQELYIGGPMGTVYVIKSAKQID